MFRSQKLKAAITQFIISHKINCIEHENTTYLECERFAEVIGCPILSKYKTDIDGRQYVDFQYVSHLCNSHYKEDQHDNTYADVVQADKEFLGTIREDSCHAFLMLNTGTQLKMPSTSDEAHPMGNPYRIGVDGTRSEVINKFKAYALKRLRTEPDWLSQIAGKDLICHCVPEDCHGDVIIELCKEFYDEVD